MTQDLSRLLAPKSIAVVGGGAWCASILSAAQQIGFTGTILPVHPSGKTIAGIPALTSLADFPGPIDAAFIGVNRHATLDIVAQLRALGAGGATCFASGFSEAAAEDATGTDLQARLLEAAGDMPILGPNCYGFLNAFDRAGIWPDQHGCRPVDRGVAILTQSSNMAINLTMQSRGLPIGYVVACGNQAQTRQTDVALHLLDDPRVTAIGLHIEGFGDLRGWEALATKARAQSIPLVAIKSGLSDQAQAAAVSHTASLAGGDAAAQAFLNRIGIARAPSLPVFLEALKLAHVFGGFGGNTLASISCSGGEAALAADTAHATSLTFPPLTPRQRDNLGAALGPMVALANPLDYHTYIWRDGGAMTRAWAAMADPGVELTLCISDYPRADICDPSDWACVTQAAIGAAQATGRRYAVVSSLPELMPQDVAHHLMDNGVAALNGLDHAMGALDILMPNTGAGGGVGVNPAPVNPAPVALPGADRDGQVLSESAAKAALQGYGVRVPKHAVVPKAQRGRAGAAAQDVGFPVAVKVLGLAHKTGANGVALGLDSTGAVDAAVQSLAAGDVLVEHMITGTIAELLVGITRDPAHGFLLTIAAGGTLTELLADSANMLIPATRDDMRRAVESLALAPVLQGYRGQKPVNMDALLDAIWAVQQYALAHLDQLEEIEINPLMCGPDTAIAADALIRIATP